jgi:hypothetical protein
MIFVKPYRKRYKTWACLTDAKTNRDLTERQAVTVICTCDVHGNFNYKTNKKMSFKYQGEKVVTALVTYYTSKTGKEFLLRFANERGTFSVGKDDRVITRPT